jgi:hypothetical protein
MPGLSPGMTRKSHYQRDSVLVARPRLLIGGADLSSAAPCKASGSGWRPRPPAASALREMAELDDNSALTGPAGNRTQTVTSDDPERTMAQREILQLVERATDNLPEIFRIVFMTRVIEGRSTTANLLGL